MRMIKQQWLPHDSETEYNPKIQCECGETVILFLNGGEMDADTCKCGLEYFSDAPLIQFWVK